MSGTAPNGCPGYDTVKITVIKPFVMQAKGDTICILDTASLMATGATTYRWSPAFGLNSTTIANPIAFPTVTTQYRVVGYDGYNCFTDTAFVTVAVGKYPTVQLGPDLVLSTGTILPLTSTVTNGPVRNWLWTPGTDLNCNICPLPQATVKKDITYVVNLTNIYGCQATDTINIKAFCENTQVFVPNVFTPDGDGINDVLMVRGKGIRTIKYFRIFNRWGELIFEKSDFPPNVVSYGWDGKIRGVQGPPDVFVYIAEVICENGTPFFYKGNTSIIK